MCTVEETKPNNWKVTDREFWGDNYLVFRLSTAARSPVYENTYIETVGLDYVPMYPHQIDVVVTTLLLINSRMKKTVAAAETPSPQGEVEF